MHAALSERDALQTRLEAVQGELEMARAGGDDARRECEEAKEAREELEAKATNRESLALAEMMMASKIAVERAVAARMRLSRPHKGT